MLSSKAPRFARSSFWRKQRRSWSRGAWFSEVRRMSSVDQLGDGQALSTNWKKPVVRWGWCFQPCVCLVRLHVCIQVVCEPASPHGYMCSCVWACVCMWWVHAACVCVCVCVCTHILVCVCGAESALGTPCCRESTGRSQVVSTHSGPTRPARCPPSSSGSSSFRTPDTGSK